MILIDSVRENLQLSTCSRKLTCPPPFTRNLRRVSYFQQFPERL